MAERSAFGTETAWKAREAQEHGQAFVAGLKPGLQKVARLSYVGETCEVLFEGDGATITVAIQPDGSYRWSDASLSGTGTVAGGIDSVLAGQISARVLGL